MLCQRLCACQRSRASTRGEERRCLFCLPWKGLRYKETKKKKSNLLSNLLQIARGMLHFYQALHPTLLSHSQNRHNPCPCGCTGSLLASLQRPQLHHTHVPRTPSTDTTPREGGKCPSMYQCFKTSDSITANVLSEASREH